MLCPTFEPGVRLRAAQLEQQRLLVARRWRLGECPAQEGRCRFWRAAADRRASGLEQPLDDPRVRARLADEQMLGDAFARARLLGKHARRSPVALRALRVGQLRVEAGADDRMTEGERPAWVENPRADELLGCGFGLVLLELRERGRLVQLALLEHRQRSCEPAGGLGQPAQPELNRTADRAGADPLDVPAPSAVGEMPLSRSAPTSSRSRNGVPRVARRQASTNAGSGVSTTLDSTKAATPVLVSGGRRMTSAEGSVTSVASSAASVPVSRGRVATTSATSSSSRRVNKKARKRSDSASAHWASSTTTHRGPAAARFAHSQYRPCRIANDGSTPDATGTRGAAG